MNRDPRALVGSLVVAWLSIQETYRKTQKFEKLAKLLKSCIKDVGTNVLETNIAQKKNSKNEGKDLENFSCS